MTVSTKNAWSLALGAGLLLGACGIPQEEHDAVKKDLEAQKQKLSAEEKARKELEGKLKTAEEEKSILDQKLTALGADQSKTQGDLAAARATLEEMQRAAKANEQRVSQFRNLLGKFQSMIDAGKLQVEVREGKMLVKLPDQILFDAGKSELKKEGKEAITQVTEILKGVEGRSFQVGGHTDNVPIKSKRFKSNWELSTARALEVVNMMVTAGMQPKRISAAGYADTQPVAPNDAAENMRKNRRIEITLVPTIEELPSMENLMKDTPASGSTDVNPNATPVEKADKEKAAEPKDAPKPEGDKK
jgi:chemotaxis protein MotB